MRFCLPVKSLAVFTVLLQFALTTSSALAQQPAANAAGQQTKTAKRKSAANSAAARKSAVSYQEDFSILPLEKNSLKLDMAVLGEKDDKPGLPFIRERWHLMWRSGDPIDVYVVKPRGIEKPPVVLYLYSYPQDTDRFKQDNWCGYATGNGFAAVGFVSALTGHRLENRALKEDFFNQLPESLGATVHDVQMILNYLASRNDLDMNRVGMFGQGSGGSIAILASAVDPRIKALDVLTPWGDWPLFLAKSTFVPSEDRLELNKPEFFARVAPLDPLQWLPKVKAQSVRVQNVRRDGHMPDDAQEFMEAAAPQTAEIDQFGDPAALVPAAANGKLLDWIKYQLQPEAKPQAALDKSQRIHFSPPKMSTTSPLGDPH
jgi:hypothetical protein